MSKPPAERAGRDDHGDDPDVPMTPEKELYPRRFPRLGSQFQTRISKSTEPSDRPAALLLSVDFPYLTTQDVDKEQQQQQQQQQQLSPTSSTPRQDIHNPSLYESMKPASDQLSSNQEQVESNTQGRSKTPLLRGVVGLRGYGQRDPLNGAETEAFDLFETLLHDLRHDVTRWLMTVSPLAGRRRGLPEFQEVHLTPAPAHEIADPGAPLPEGALEGDARSRLPWRPCRSDGSGIARRRLPVRIGTGSHTLPGALV